jgi:hypothetical protein
LADFRFKKINLDVPKNLDALSLEVMKSIKIYGEIPGLGLLVGIVPGLLQLLDVPLQELGAVWVLHQLLTCFKFGSFLLNYKLWINIVLQQQYVERHNKTFIVHVPAILIRSN